MGYYRNYTKEQLEEAVKNSKSYKKVMEYLNIKAMGGNYATIKKKVIELNLDTSHFTGMLWSKGLKIGDKYPTIDYLTNLRCICSHKLKKRLIKEKYFDYKCYKCNLNEWNNLPIPLELEHIDGDHSNNRIENLTILCPNCHAQTATYRRSKDSLKSG